MGLILFSVESLLMPQSHHTPGQDSQPSDNSNGCEINDDYHNYVLTGCSWAVFNKNRTSTHGARTDFRYEGSQSIPFMPLFHWPAMLLR